MPKPISDQVHRQQRSRLLNQIKCQVQQHRMQSLHRTVLTELVQETPPLRIRRTWDIEAKVGNRPSFRLKADGGILPIFDRIGGKLLILGATGSGKTTTLMGLTKALVSRALIDREEPIPVLLNLNTWSKDQPIANWIAEQLQAKYAIPLEISWHWLNELQLLPLLDGFDEVEPGWRDLCLQNINELLIGHLCPLHLVVCSETAAYKSCQNRLQLNGAILLRPLSKKQIREYLIKARSRELWVNIESDPNLMNLAKKPLFLSLMALTVEELLIASWKRLDSLEEQRQYLFNAYIRRQITQNREPLFSGQNLSSQNLSSQNLGKQSLGKRNAAPSPEQSRQWLSWLAKQLESENRTEFSPYEIPAHWLQTSDQEKTYSLGVRIISGLVWWGIVIWMGLGAIAGSMFGVLSGAIAGLLWALLSKLLPVNDWIEGFVLRSILSSSGYLPWQYRQFLNGTTQRLILQKVGNRYQFIHRLLQRHFSQL
ncbi:MAG: NACHT domain-containing protein [Microcoleaceae cyanobacterium]